MPKTHVIKTTEDFSTFVLSTDDFDYLLDHGFDDIAIVTPRGRWVASIDDWLDYSYFDNRDHVDIRVMNKSYMSKA